MDNNYQNDEGESVFTLNQMAKHLDFNVGRSKLMELFRSWGILLQDNSPSQAMIRKGYMKYRIKLIHSKPEKRVPVTLVTVKGLAYFRKLIPRKLKEQTDGKEK